MDEQVHMTITLYRPEGGPVGLERGGWTPDGFADALANHANDCLEDAGLYGVGARADRFEQNPLDLVADNTRLRAALQAAWGALDRNDVPAAYDALDVD
jgi:hypothetical protein